MSWQDWECRHLVAWAGVAVLGLLWVCNKKAKRRGYRAQHMEVPSSVVAALAAAEKEHKKAVASLKAEDFWAAFRDYENALRLEHPLIRWHFGLCQVDYGDVPSGMANMMAALRTGPQHFSLEDRMKLKAANGLLLMQCLPCQPRDHQQGRSACIHLLSLEWDRVFSSPELTKLDAAALSIWAFLNDRQTRAKTLWYPVGRSPRNSVEKAIARLLPLAEEMQKQLQCGGSLLGCEYWVRLQTSRRGVAMHYDMDVPAKSSSQIFLPALSSILYLGSSPHGDLEPGPTVILSQRPHYEAGVVNHVPPVPPSGKFIWPRRGRYAVFPGTLHHGVLPSNSDLRRVTVLVNYWRGDKDCDHAPKPPACVEPAADLFPNDLSLTDAVSPTRCACHSSELQPGFSSRLGFLEEFQALPVPCPDSPCAGGVLQLRWQ